MPQDMCTEFCNLVEGVICVAMLKLFFFSRCMAFDNLVPLHDELESIVDFMISLILLPLSVATGCLQGNATTTWDPEQCSWPMLLNTQ